MVTITADVDRMSASTAGSRPAADVAVELRTATGALHATADADGRFVFERPARPGAVRRPPPGGRASRRW